MVIRADVEYAEQLAHVVLRRLGEPFDSWTLHEVDLELGFPNPPRPEWQPGDYAILKLRPPGETETVGAYFPLGIPRNEATVIAAGEIQERALEHSRGAAIPPCPGHSHPLRAQLIDSIPSWVCPSDPRHHAEPIPAE